MTTRARATAILTSVAGWAILSAACSGHDPDAPIEAGPDSATPSYCGARQDSQISGVGFDAWEGQPVSGCYVGVQTLCSYGCGSSVVKDGRFSVTAWSTVSAFWDLTIGDQAHAFRCQPEVRSGTIHPCDCARPCESDSGAESSPDALDEPD
jgi:hypothetical protein